MPFNQASPDETPASPLRSTNNPINVNPDAAFSPSTGLLFPISLPENDQSKTTEELPPFPPFTSLLSDVQPLLSRPNRLKFQLDHSVLKRQHRREYYTNHTREQNDSSLINTYNTVSSHNSPPGKQSFG